MKIKDIRKEYGVDGYVDYVAEIRAGKVVHTVHFSGGTESGYGRTPAKFATSDIALQFIIERSKQFKTGKIRLLSGKPWVSAVSAPVPASARASVPNRSVALSAPERELQPPSPSPEVPPVAPSAPVRELQPEAPAPEASQGRERVECATLGDAQIVLKERFGVASSRAHNREKAIALGKQNGIEIIFK